LLGVVTLVMGATYHLCSVGTTQPHQPWLVVELFLGQRPQSAFSLGITICVVLL
jgi:hypothetical protein